MPLAYLPHVSVSQPELRKALVKIAVVCQTLDSAFAEYFRTVINRLKGTTEILRQLREQICSRQSSNMRYIGALGEYCEQVNTVSLAEMQAPMQYQGRVTGDKIQPYLQDALEVPYWSMMADQFVRSSHINNQLNYDAVLSVISDKRRELNLRLRQIKQKWKDSLPQVIEDGIARRIGILDDLLARTPDKYDSLEEAQVQALQKSPTSGLDVSADSSDFTMPLASGTVTATATASSTDGITDLVCILS